MYTSKLIQLLRTLSYKEMKRLGKFVESPFFNENEEVVQLFSYIRSHLGEEAEKEALSKERVFAALFPTEPFKDLRIRHLMSALNKLTKRFLSIRNRSRCLAAISSSDSSGGTSSMLS